MRISDTSHQTISALLTIEELKQQGDIIHLKSALSSKNCFHILPSTRFLTRLFSLWGHNHKEMQNRAEDMKCCVI